ncbi:hypothetical protein Tco_0211760 [Tanacetum coccineum]
MLLGFHELPGDPPFGDEPDPLLDDEPDTPLDDDTEPPLDDDPDPISCDDNPDPPLDDDPGPLRRENLIVDENSSGSYCGSTPSGTCKTPEILQAGSKSRLLYSAKLARSLRKWYEHGSDFRNVDECHREPHIVLRGCSLHNRNGYEHDSVFRAVLLLTGMDIEHDSCFVHSMKAGNVLNMLKKQEELRRN